jgi:ribulose-phosphate 3-epimerase
MKHLIAPSLLSADFGHLADDIDMINRSEADWFHVDIMDGNFVPNLSFGFPVLKAIGTHAKKPLDVHLMILDPDRYIQQFRDYGAHVITVHYEACTHLHRSLQMIRKCGAMAGLALNPHTPVRLIESVLEDIDLLLIMSVNPGFGGQTFIPSALKKIEVARGMIKQSSVNTLIEVDGGVDQKNAGTILKAGADVLVAGNAVFGAESPSEMIRVLKNLPD